MLTSVRKLIEGLKDKDISYCHWKSNVALADGLSGRTDIDLLIHRKDAARFRALLGEMGYKPAITTGGKPFPSVEHYHMFDETTGVLVHVHAYYRVITGDSLAKNYRFPIETMLLENTREIEGIRTPAKSAELVVFTLRIMLKHTSLMELFLLGRYWETVPQEAAWLLETASVDETLGLIERWLPAVDSQLVAECIAAIQAPAPLHRRIQLGRRLRAQLRLYKRRSSPRAWLAACGKFSSMAWGRLTRSRKGMIPGNGGVTIAFVGSEATGKSTLLAETKRWLGEHFTVKQVHAGKPQPTLLSFVPAFFVPMLRTLLPHQRSTRVEQRVVSDDSSNPSVSRFPMMFGIRSALLAYDRRSLLTKVGGRAANGAIVLCDRYPCAVSGAPDSPQLSHLPVPPGRYSMRRLLANLESRLYRQIPPPDLVIHLTAPLEVTMKRNAERDKVEPEDYVRRRHARSCAVDFGTTPVFRINTDQPFDQTVREVQQAIWSAL